MFGSLPSDHCEQPGSLRVMPELVVVVYFESYVARACGSRVQKRYKTQGSYGKDIRGRHKWDATIRRLHHQPANQPSFAILPAHSFLLHRYELPFEALARANSTHIGDLTIFVVKQESRNCRIRALHKPQSWRVSTPISTPTCPGRTGTMIQSLYLGACWRTTRSSGK